MDNKRVVLLGDNAAASAGALSKFGHAAADATDAMDQLGGKMIDYKARNEATDRRWVQGIVARNRKAELRKDKDRRGVLRLTYQGGVEAKLRKQFGGKRAQRVLKAERRAGRDYPDELKLIEIATVNVPDGKGGQVETKAERDLVRGVDFAIVIDGGEMILVVDDAVKEFRAVSELNDGALAQHLTD